MTRPVAAGAGTYLDRILAHKRQEIEVRFAATDIAELRRIAEARDDHLSLSAALKDDGIQVIAEVKRKSPSKGEFREHLDPVELAEAYLAGGAAAISVLTDHEFFGGSLQDLRDIHASAAHAAGLAILQKEFVIDERQVVEGAAAGSDAILLIVAAVGSVKLRDLQSRAWGLGMEVLVEVHDQSELETAMECEALIIGVNSRDLRTFNTDLETTERLLGSIPEKCVRVAESGIKSRADVERMGVAGADAVLVGETLMIAEDPASAIRELRGC